MLAPSRPPSDRLRRRLFQRRLQRPHPRPAPPGRGPAVRGEAAPSLQQAAEPRPRARAELGQPGAPAVAHRLPGDQARRRPRYGRAHRLQPEVLLPEASDRGQIHRHAGGRRSFSPTALLAAAAAAVPDLLRRLLLSFPSALAALASVQQLEQGDEVVGGRQENPRGGGEVLRAPSEGQGAGGAVDAGRQLQGDLERLATGTARSGTVLGDSAGIHVVLRGGAVVSPMRAGFAGLPREHGRGVVCGRTDTNRENLTCQGCVCLNLGRCRCCAVSRVWVRFARHGHQSGP